MRHIATLRVEVDANTVEARDAVLERLIAGVNFKPPSVHFDGSAFGEVLPTVEVSRVRPKSRKRGKK